jgi:serine protease Do
MRKKAHRHCRVVYLFERILKSGKHTRKHEIEQDDMKPIFERMGSRFAAFALGGAVVIAGTALASSQRTKADSKTPVVNVTVDERPISRELGSHASFSPVVKKVAPAVVKVVTVAKVRNTGFVGPQGPGMDDFMRRFFGDGSDGNGRQMRRGSGVPRQEGVGSGVIASKDGYILTNNHVVDGADEVKVSLQDGRDFTAKVIGRDPKSDIAVIKIEATDLPALAMADSEKVEIGDVVLAIGNPFGIGQTVTTGIVSATGRGNMARL